MPYLNSVSLTPRPIHFYFLVCIYNNTQKQKGYKNREGLRIIRAMDTEKGQCPATNTYPLNLRASFLPVRTCECLGSCMPSNRVLSDDFSVLLECGPHPCISYDKSSLFLIALQLQCTIMNTNKAREAWE